MSHKRYIGLLAHHESRYAKATSFIPAEQAEDLVRQLVAERISQRVIRMLEPSSVFLNFRPATIVNTVSPAHIHVRLLPPSEIPGLHFEPPDYVKHEHKLRDAEARERWSKWKKELEMTHIVEHMNGLEQNSASDPTSMERRLSLSAAATVPTGDLTNSSARRPLQSA